MIPKLIPTKIIGLDLGIKDLVITSNGKTKDFTKYQHTIQVVKYVQDVDTKIKERKI